MLGGDRHRLRQILANLVSNALKFTSDGTITLRGAIEREIGTALRIRFEVSDTGIGIPADKLPHIFERFYRVDKARSADGESIGLGLAIVKSILTAHGAEVVAESTAGKGTCFRVRLPISKPAPQPVVKTAT